MTISNSTNSSAAAPAADSSSQIQQQQQASSSTTAASATQSSSSTSSLSQGSVQHSAPTVAAVVASKLSSSVSVDSTSTATSSMSTAPSPLPSAPTPPSSAASTLSLVNGPSKGVASSAAAAPAVIPSSSSLTSSSESISLRAMAQHAVDQQVSAPVLVSDSTTSNLLYDTSSSTGNMNSSSNNNNNPGVVGSGRTGSVQLSAPSLAPQPSAPTGEAHIPPLLGVAPLGPVALSKEQQVFIIFCFIHRTAIVGDVLSHILSFRLDSYDTTREPSNNLPALLNSLEVMLTNTFQKLNLITRTFVNDFMVEFINQKRSKISKQSE